MINNSLVRNAAGTPVARMTQLPRVAAVSVNTGVARPAPGPVTQVRSIGTLSTITVNLDSTAAAATYIIGDGDNLAQKAIGASYTAPTSTGVAGLTGAQLNASFSNSPVKIASMNMSVNTFTATFGVPMVAIYGERNGSFRGDVIDLSSGRSSSDYNPKIRIFDFAPGTEPILSRNRGLRWALPITESANIILFVAEYRE